MSLRVVLYAEGASETGSKIGLQRAPGEALPDDELGPAHVLLRRCLELEKKMPLGAVRFEAPLRNRRGNVARGSELYDRASLRRLLTWPLIAPNQPARPDLVVVFVDGDGESDRKQKLDGWTADLPVERVVGVAVQEFEAWLIADSGAVHEVIQVASPTRDLETMKPREAKDLFGSWVRDKSAVEARDVRKTLAQSCDLDVIAKRCSAFASFRKELRGLPATMS